MPRSASARRYAQAVFQIAVERNELDAWTADLALLATTLQNEGLTGLLDAPRVPYRQKAQVLEETVGDAVGPLARNLALLLASRSLVHIAPDIVDQFQRLVDDRQGIGRAEAVSAVPIDDGQRRNMEEFLRRVSGKQIRLTSRVDPQILGGLVLRVGDRVIDGSTRARLTAMRRELVERVT